MLRYNPLLFGTVPVVYGGADYEAIGAPPNSYIDVRNFESARHLAHFLQFLDHNDAAYRKYFQWRLQPPGLGSLRRVEPWCDLCQKLIDSKRSSSSWSSPVSYYYGDIYSWWFVQGTCRPPIQP